MFDSMENIRLGPKLGVQLPARQHPKPTLTEPSLPRLHLSTLYDNVRQHM